MTEELKPIDVSKYTVTESGNVIRTDNKETLKNALERITELEKENEKLKEQIEQMKCCHNLEEAFLAGLKAKTQWHKLDWEKDFPKVGQLIRVRTHGGMEYICEPDYYEPAEDEIGYGEVIIQFYDLKGEWVDDNEVEYWCELPTFKEV